MTILELVKMLLDIDATDTSKDNILNHFINKAINIILGYCCITELAETYNDVVADFAVYLYKNKDSEGISKKTEGERSIQYEGGIPENIKMALPLPRIKVGAYIVL